MQFSSIISLNLKFKHILIYNEYFNNIYDKKKIVGEKQNWLKLVFRNFSGQKPLRGKSKKNC